MHLCRQTVWFPFCTLSQHYREVRKINDEQEKKENLPVFVAIPVKTGSSELPIFKVVVRKKSSGMIGTIKRNSRFSIYSLDRTSLIALVVV